MIYKLYKNGNVNCDIEPEDKIVPSNSNYIATESYSSDSNIGIKRNTEMFIKSPVFVDIKAPWSI